jgi:hypothetical protein
MTLIGIDRSTRPKGLLLADDVVVTGNVVSFSPIKTPPVFPVGAAYALAQDGGLAVDDLTAQLPGTDSATLTKEFFLS